MATTSSQSVGILNNAYQISQTAGRPVAYSDQYNHMCARGASAVAASMTNNPALFDKVAANAWDSRSKYQTATDTNGNALYNANQDYPPGGVTSADLSNVPPGTVVTFQYGAYGHAMTFMGNDPTTGQPQWASDNVNDSPDKFLTKSNLEGVSIITPTAAGQAAISQQCGNLATGQQAAYTLPAGGTANGSGAAAVGSTFSNSAADQPLTPDQAITLNSEFFNSLGPGASAPVEPLEALQSKAQNPYSNKQLVTPVSITFHVEGVDIDTDLMTKSLATNSYNKAKQNSVLALKQRTLGANPETGSDPIIHKLKLSKGIAPAPTKTNPQPTDTFVNQHNLSQSIFNAGNAGIVQNLAGRIPNLNSLVSGNASLTSALNTLNSLPGVAGSFNQLLNNPLGALTQFTGLNLQAGLPSLFGAGGNGSGSGSPGLINSNTNPLSQAFSLASNIGSSNIPSSITGAVQLALQLKAIVCNLKIPNITGPDIQNLLKINFSAAEKHIQELIVHELRAIENALLAELNAILNPFAAIIKQIEDFFKPNNIKKLLASIVPDVNDLIKNTVNEFTKCNDGPGAKKNDLSGNDPTGTAPTVTATDANGGFNGFANEEGAKVLAQTGSVDNVKVTAADKAAAAAAYPTSDSGFKGFPPGTKVINVKGPGLF